MTNLPRGGGAVMNSRKEPPDSLEFFPTPPWATRALCKFILPPQLALRSFWDPCAGEGHMYAVLSEFFGRGHASDVHDYGMGYAVGSFVGEGPDRAHWPIATDAPDWIIFNPPFGLALDFVQRALGEAREGVAALMRSNWSEGCTRYDELFSKTPPTVIAQFAERVPMTKGRWDPEASTATSYSWFVWEKGGQDVARTNIWLRGSYGAKHTDFVWIPPGQRQALERGDDRRCFSGDVEPNPDQDSLF